MYAPRRSLQTYRYKNLSYILIRKRAEEWSAAGINQHPAAQLREPECNGGRQLVPLARRMPPEQRSATSLPDVANRAPERMRPVTNHRCLQEVCRLARTSRVRECRTSETHNPSAKKWLSEIR